MSKFIDAEKLRSVLQNTINSMKEKDVKGERYDAFLNGKLSICEELLGCIDSLQQEQAEVELERELRDYFSKWGYNIYNGAITMDNGIVVTLSSIQNVARHFYELGLNARKK